MSVRAFVLIQTEIKLAKATDVVTALRQLGPGVKSADRVTGPYDIIAELEAESLSDIMALIEEQIRTTRGVYRIVTCLVV